MPGMPSTLPGSTFLVLVNYTAPIARIDELLEKHRAWLDEHFATGTFLASGARVPREGGVVVARAESREAVETLIADDPFARAGVATHEVVEFAPTRGPLAGLLAGAGDLRGLRFEEADLTEAEFENVDLTRARFHNVYLSGARIRGADMSGVDIDGDITGLRVNEVDVEPLVEAELDRRYPDRAKLRPTDADGFREAWAVVEGAWGPTIERARRLPPELLHARVDGEWSFIETLRHLVMATDAWVLRAFLGRPSPFHPLGLPHTEMGEVPGVPNDPDARPSLDEILAVRAERMGIVREVMAGLTDDVLTGMTEPVTAPGYPAPEAYAVRRCLGAVVNEEWLHRLFAERDLAVLEKSGGTGL
jgi:uncharacterized protein YciI